jgi:hypothetical protein
MVTDNKFFLLHKKQFSYLDKDPVFEVEGAVSRQESTGACYICSETLKSNSNDVLFCAFCGQACCKNCRAKERPYPKKNLGHSARGDVCLVCDRKFFIREMIKESTVNIENN